MQNWVLLGAHFLLCGELHGSPAAGREHLWSWCGYGWYAGRRRNSPLELLSLMTEKTWDGGRIGMALLGWRQVGLT